MLVKDLIKKLQELDQDLEVTVLDGFNGGGQPRTINLGPVVYNPKKHNKHVNSTYNYEDIETQNGLPIVEIGYGCY